MRTITIELLNDKALELLRQLEQMKVLKLLNPPTKRSSQKNIGTEFEEYFLKWKAETLFFSSGTQITNHPDYQNIIKMGKSVIPFILIKLKEDPQHLFHALYKITGENPVQSENIGNLKAMTNDWLIWGQEQGY
jgi:hypothetical protein